jgi:hypothetical protein
VVVGLGLVAEHPHAYVACVGVLGCPLTHLCLQECDLIASECDSSALHREVASSDTR